ncbi:scavenger receptor class B member 1 [Lucilia cuprina]|uniref:scavenger receptor class B member 1 n=1 Tax=Lucilia cuprina TaxID=7375 RepID=UPI001F06C090|nr:scavenger receptor class B member 1 [Lucilia cuprina]
MKLFTTNSSKTANVLKLASLGMTLTILAAVILCTDPVAKIVDSQLAIKTGSLLYNLWLKPPLNVYITVYMFNVTNLDAFTRGLDAKLKIAEVGPYVYQEILENHNVTFNANNTVTYTPRRIVKFLREKSVGDPKVDKIIAPNIPYMGVTSAASGFSTFAALAISALTRRLNSKPMLEMSVHEYLWGYEDNLVYLASKIIPNVINFQRFGLMERMFDEGDNIVTMQLPSKKPRKASDKSRRDFAIDTWNGRKSIKYWTPNGNSTLTNCNSIQGTYDATLFPRNITKGETFRIYRKAICRTLPIVYSHPGKIDGIEAYHFKLHEKAFDSDINDPNSSCFCTNKKCLRKGLGNITPCYYNIPLAISFPHFFNGDPSLLEPFEGLNPNEEKHGSEIVIQPQLGIPMKVRSRFQINLLMDEVKYNREMTRFRNTVLPIFWLEIGVEELTPGIKMLLKLLFKICPYVQCGLIIALIVAGLSLVGTALLSCFWLPSTTTISSSMQRHTKQKCNILLTESSVEAAAVNKNKMNKTNVCIVPLLPAPPTSAKALEQMVKQDEKMTTLMLLLPPQVDQQKTKESKLKQLKNKFCKKNNKLLPFLQNEFMTT